MSKPKKITIDLSAWEMGDWGEQFSEFVTVENSYRTITVEIKLHEQFDALARKIAKESIEMFLDRGMNCTLTVRATNKGIEIGDENDVIKGGTIIDGEETGSLIIPWENILLGDLEDCNPIQEWLNDQKAMFEGD